MWRRPTKRLHRTRTAALLSSETPAHRARFAPVNRGPLDGMNSGNSARARPLLAWFGLGVAYLVGIAVAVLAKERGPELFAWSAARGLVGLEVQRLLVQVGTIVASGAALSVSFALWHIGELRRQLSPSRSTSQAPQTVGFLGGLVLFILALVAISP
jgi:hypothetical protein